MRSISLSAIACLAASVSAAPALWPAPPASNNQDPASFAAAAGGGVPNGGAPSNISATAVGGFTAVNFLENFEAGFFAQAIEWIQGWNHDGSLNLLLEVVTAIHAQEEIHIATAEAILKKNNKPTLEPCKYTFNGIDSVQDFIELANIITVTGIGAVIDLEAKLAVSDPTLIQGPASILGNEARQDAFFRLADVTIDASRRTGNIEIDVLAPQPAPFDTRLTGVYALNLASKFISDCPANQPNPMFPKIPALNADLPPQQRRVTGSSGPIKFKFDENEVKNAPAKAFIGWVNQANKVNYVDATITGGVVYATIPDGLAGAAFAVLTDQNTIPDVTTLTTKTLAGPAVVIVS